MCIDTCAPGGSTTHGAVIGALAMPEGGLAVDVTFLPPAPVPRTASGIQAEIRSRATLVVGVGCQHQVCQCAEPRELDADDLACPQPTRRLLRTTYPCRCTSRDHVSRF